LLLFAVALEPVFAGPFVGLVAIWPFDVSWDDLSQISSITKTHVKSERLDWVLKQLCHDLARYVFKRALTVVVVGYLNQCYLLFIPRFSHDS
jgi:hypothetical protein